MPFLLEANFSQTLCDSIKKTTNIVVICMTVTQNKPRLFGSRPARWGFQRKQPINPMCILMSDPLKLVLHPDDQRVATDKTILTSVLDSNARGSGLVSWEGCLSPQGPLGPWGGKPSFEKTMATEDSKLTVWKVESVWFQKGHY